MKERKRPTAHLYQEGKVPPGRRERPDSDVEWATFELRPDHSRAVQYLLEAGREAEVRELLREAQVKKCQLFEETTVM